MKNILSLIAVTAFLVLTNGCVSVHRDAPEATTTRTTTITPAVPGPAVTTRTTTY